MKPTNIFVTVFGVILRVALAILVVYVIYQGSQLCYDYGYRIFTEPAVSSGEGRIITVAVTENMSPKEIGILFENKGLVRDGRLFMLQYYLSEYKNDVMPGVFELSTSMTAEEMMEAMTGNKEEAGAENGSAGEKKESGAETGSDEESGSNDESLSGAE